MRTLWPESFTRGLAIAPHAARLQTALCRRGSRWFGRALVLPPRAPCRGLLERSRLSGGSAHSQRPQLLRSRGRASCTNVAQAKDSSRSSHPATMVSATALVDEAHRPRPSPVIHTPTVPLQKQLPSATASSRAFTRALVEEPLVSAPAPSVRELPSDGRDQPTPRSPSQCALHQRRRRQPVPLRPSGHPATPRLTGVARAAFAATALRAPSAGLGSRAAASPRSHQKPSHLHCQRLRPSPIRRESGLPAPMECAQAPFRAGWLRRRVGKAATSARVHGGLGWCGGEALAAESRDGARLCELKVLQKALVESATQLSSATFG